jgi:hypothetical protein
LAPPPKIGGGAEVSYVMLGATTLISSRSFREVRMAKGQMKSNKEAKKPKKEKPKAGAITPSKGTLGEHKKS